MNEICEECKRMSLVDIGVGRCRYWDKLIWADNDICKMFVARLKQPERKPDSADARKAIGE